MTVPSPAPIRNDLDVPVMVVEAEGDVIGSNLGARQPDTAMFREWELAGTSHADSYTTSVGFGDIGDGAAPRRCSHSCSTRTNSAAVVRSTRAAHHWILQAAFRGLETWVRTGVAPPVATPLVATSTSPVVLARDAQGNALGGVRSPQVDAPDRDARRGQHGSRASASCSAARRRSRRRSSQQLYPTHQDFVTKWAVSLFVNTLNGFLLPEDVGELYSAAAAAPIPS